MVRIIQLGDITIELRVTWVYHWGSLGIFTIVAQTNGKQEDKIVGLNIMFINKVLHQRITTILLAVPLMVTISNVLAQDDYSDESMVLEEVIVTAQKREQNLQEIPISIKAIMAETLETVGADSLDEIVRLVPSLSMTDLSRGGNNVQIRGLGSNVGNVGTVAIYNDGVISAGRIQSSGTFAE